MTAETTAPASGGAGERERIADAITKADAAFGYNFNLTRLVDGEETHTLSMPGFDPVEFEDRDDGYRLIAERRNRLRADAILAALHPHPTGEGRDQDQRDLDDLVAEWRASLANPSTWRTRLRALLSPPPAADAVPEGWVPIAEACPDMRYMGAFKSVLGGWTIVGLGRVKDGVFCDHLGRWEQIDRVFHLPPADLLSARPLAATGKGVGTPSRSDGGGNG